ncbi:unnamed protein product [Gadus morhua 'NCC']
MVSLDKRACGDGKSTPAFLQAPPTGHCRRELLSHVVGANSGPGSTAGRAEREGQALHPPPPRHPGGRVKEEAETPIRRPIEAPPDHLLHLQLFCFFSLCLLLRRQRSSYPTRRRNAAVICILFDLLRGPGIRQSLRKVSMLQPAVERDWSVTQVTWRASAEMIVGLSPTCVNGFTGHGVAALQKLYRGPALARGVSELGMSSSACVEMSVAVSFPSVEVCRPFQRQAATPLTVDAGPSWSVLQRFPLPRFPSSAAGQAFTVGLEPTAQSE